jgi:hypothetical protein
MKTSKTFSAAENKTAYDFNRKLHNIGRIWMLLGVCLFLAVPITFSLYFDAKPNWAVFANAAVLIPLVLNFLSGIVEPIVYSPMIGTNGEYLAFITGNLSSLKIPCVVKAQEIAGTKVGTEENELVSTIAIATSSLVTFAVLAVFVIVLTFSRAQDAIRSQPFLAPAFGCVVYALFGSLGGKYLAKNPKLAIVPGIVIVALSIILGVFKINPKSMYLFIGIALCLVFAMLQYKREKRKLAEKEERMHLEAIAAGISDAANAEIEKSWETGCKIAPRKSKASDTYDVNSGETSEEKVAEEVTEIIDTIFDDKKHGSDNNKAV